MLASILLTVLPLATAGTPNPRAPAPVNTTTCNGAKYTYQSLAGYGYLPSDAYDKYGDTIGGIGSSVAFAPSSWKHDQKTDRYTAIVWASPDRGWNTQGTLNYQARLHKFALSLDPMPDASVDDPSGPNIKLEYLDTILLTDPAGNPTTGLDGDPSGNLTFRGFPALPVATFTGDGFGGPGPGGKLVPVDDEGLVANRDGSFWVSDEYGPYIYRYSSSGKMQQAIRPPDAYIPTRNGGASFSADSPTEYSGLDDDVSPHDPDSGRGNNHGLEGLTASPDGKTLYALLQESAIQDGGKHGDTENNVRMLVYSVQGETPSLTAEYAVQLPRYTGHDGDVHTAGQSEIHHISATQFLVLSRDSDSGRGQDDAESIYRHADVLDISSATNIAGGRYDAAAGAVAPEGRLDPAVQPATYCPFLDYNVNAQLNRFGVHNGGAQDAGLLNEKWESLALAPVDGGDYVLFSFSDNDFVTQNGRQDFGRFDYTDGSGFDLDNQVLAFRVTLPEGADPL